MLDWNLLPVCYQVGLISCADNVGAGVPYSHVGVAASGCPPVVRGCIYPPGSGVEKCGLSWYN